MSNRDSNDVLTGITDRLPHESNLKPKLIQKLLIATTAFFLSVITISFCSETFLRIQKKGVIKGLQSYVQTEPPYSYLGSNDWIVTDPTLGYRLNPTHKDINIYSIKSGPLIVPKPNGVRRIVILGDSVPYTGNPTFVDILKEQYKITPNIEIINASTPGYTNYQELLFLEQYVLPLQPDIVLLCYVVNDNHKFLHKFDTANDRVLTDEALKSLDIYTSWDAFISKSYLLTAIKIAWMGTEHKRREETKFFWENEADFNTAWKDESWNDVENQILRMNELMKNAQGKFLVVAFPIESQLDNALLNMNRAYVLKPQLKLAEFTHEHQLPYLDLYPSFYAYAQSKKTSPIFTDGLHLTTAGHTLVAKLVYDFLNASPQY